VARCVSEEQREQREGRIERDSEVKTAIRNEGVGVDEASALAGSVRRELEQAAVGRDGDESGRAGRAYWKGVKLEVR
jgi:hypothetical protein